jgi:transcriptional regulator NrdR family protein
MKCPTCGKSTRVYETRSTGSQRFYGYRRRECSGPDKHRFKTIEVTADELNRLRGLAAKFETLRRLVGEEL